MRKMYEGCNSAVTWNILSAAVSETQQQHHMQDMQSPNDNVIIRAAFVAHCVPIYKAHEANVGTFQLRVV